MGWLGSAEERAQTLRQAAEIVGAYSADLERTPWDMCDCGHRRRDHIGGVGCTDEHYCYPQDACKRFRRDDDWVGPERDDLVAWLRRLADGHQAVADGRETAEQDPAATDPSWNPFDELGSIDFTDDTEATS